ncbi:MAG: hypothetical protein IJ055_00030 [Oscillospiraceae bacterium]|nr:hypothetical protein [Oscillospiraceae bacterium]
MKHFRHCLALLTAAALFGAAPVPAFALDDPAALADPELPEIPEEQEDNNLLANANELVPGGSVRGALSDSADMDSFRLEITEPGTLDAVFRLNVTEENDDIRHWAILLYGADKKTIAFDYMTHENNEWHFTNDVMPGIYYLRIKVPQAGIHSDDPYTLSTVFEAQEATLEPPPEPETDAPTEPPTQAPTEAPTEEPTQAPTEPPENTAPEYATALTVGNAEVGACRSAEEMRYYTFEITEPGLVRVAFSPVQSGTSTAAANWTITLTDAQGRAMTTDACHDDGAQTPVNVGLKAGTYGLIVEPYTTAAFTDIPYTMTVQLDAQAACEHEYNETQADADPLAVGESIEGALQQARDVDCYKIRIRRSGKLDVHFSIDAPDPYKTGSYWEVCLLGADGTLLTSVPGYLMYDGTDLETWDCVPGNYYLTVRTTALNRYSGQAYTLTTSYLEDPYTLGDVNEDGSINANDASKVLLAAARIGAKKESGLTDLQTYAADVDCNGTVNANDASRILLYAALWGAGRNPVL